MSLNKALFIVLNTIDGSFEYPQHIFWLRNKKNNFQLHTLIWGPVTTVSFQMTKAIADCDVKHQLRLTN